MPSRAHDDDLEPDFVLEGRNEETEEQDQPQAWTDEEEFGADDERVVPLVRPELDPSEWEVDESLDTTDVHVEGVEQWIRPAWLITSGFTERDLGTVKSGKEAEVRLVSRSAGERSCLLAVKRYRPRAERAFRREEEYRAGQGFGDDRVDRAVGKRSKFGRAVLEYAWAYREYPLLKRAWDAGVRVPYPVEPLEDGFVMQFLGDNDGPAPRLADVRLGHDEACDVFADLVEQTKRLLDAYLVHADLSAFNVLWWQDKPWLIDFPQACDVSSSRGMEFLRRDVANICKWFRRFGVDEHPGDVLNDVLADAPFAWIG